MKGKQSDDVHKRRKLKANMKLKNYRIKNLDRI